MRRKHRLKFAAFLLSVSLCLTLAACGSGPVTEGGSPAETPENVSEDTADATAPEIVASEPENSATKGVFVEPPGDGPASRSAVEALNGVPMATLNNGVQIPGWDLGRKFSVWKRAGRMTN